MPNVRGYFRRSPGASTSLAPKSGRQPLVRIYGASTGNNLLRYHRQAPVLDLQFSTGLPGGFLSATFTLRTPAPKVWPVDTGQKVQIYWGNQVVWYGWVEDVVRKQRGRTTELGVLCLGPWQLCQQRLAVSFPGGEETSDGIKSALFTYCDRISSDYEHIAATGITTEVAAQQFITVAQIIQNACSIGNDSEQQMLFALWEPDATRLEPLLPTNLVPNGSFEIGAGAVATGWTLVAAAARIDDDAHEGSWMLGMFDALSPPPVTTAETTDYISVTYGKDYLFSMYYKSNPDIGYSEILTVYINWYDAGSGLVSTLTWVSGTDYVAVSTAWTLLAKFITPPATATKCKIKFECSGLNGSVYYIDWIDSVGLYELGETAGVEAKPVPWFWARDLSSADYLLHTGRLDAPLDLTESTRDLANAVWVDGSAGYTVEAQDATSQATYRRRDVVVSESDLDATAAAAARDTYIARYKDPQDEPGSFTLSTPGAITTTHGAYVALPLIRAGQRLMIVDGAYAGRIVLIKSTQWSASGLQITPERELGTAELLALV